MKENIKPCLLYTSIDASLFEQVLVNIIKNAAESIEAVSYTHLTSAGWQQYLRTVR